MDPQRIPICTASTTSEQRPLPRRRCPCDAACPGQDKRSDKLPFRPLKRAAHPIRRTAIVTRLAQPSFPRMRDCPEQRSNDESVAELNDTLRPSTGKLSPSRSALGRVSYRGTSPLTFLSPRIWLIMLTDRLTAVTVTPQNARHQRRASLLQLSRVNGVLSPRLPMLAPGCAPSSK